jgi:hypothetical protein
MIAEDSLFSLTRLHDHLTTHRSPGRWRKEQGRGDCVLNWFLTLRVDISGILKGFTVYQLHGTSVQKASLLRSIDTPLLAKKDEISI